MIHSLTGFVYLTEILILITLYVYPKPRASTDPFHFPIFCRFVLLMRSDRVWMRGHLTRTWRQCWRSSHRWASACHRARPWSTLICALNPRSSPCLRSMWNVSHPTATPRQPFRLPSLLLNYITVTHLGLVVTVTTSKYLLPSQATGSEKQWCTYWR